jgi:thiol-disulfide isomerase/thioredoxin
VQKVITRRTADPYADLEVIDARAPRFNQAVVAITCLVALATGWWGLVGVLALQLTAGLLLGRQWCLPCAFYFRVVQPVFGEGPIEDARPPRFANQVGALFLWSATLSHVANLRGLGEVLTGGVGVLALLAVTTGFCLGCSIYRFAARLRGLRSDDTNAIDLGELGVASPGPVVVHFTHPLCSDCQTMEAKLRSDGQEVVAVDVSSRRDLADRYNVLIVPTTFAVGGDGRVLARLA